MRSNESGTNKLTYLTGDRHGTASLALNPDTAQSFTKRYTTPFGADRGRPAYGPWPDDKGFLGKTRDATTGLTHIGAREYDSGTGQFLSTDPLLDPSDPQSLNGYGYADNNPVTNSDPSGLCRADQCGVGTPKGDGSGDIIRDGPIDPGNVGAGSCHNGSCGTVHYTDGTTSADTAVSNAAVTGLLGALPSADNGWDGSRLHQVWVQYGYSTDGNGYWDAPVGDGDRTAMACFGRTACQQAAKVWANTHDLAQAKLVAATYCYYNVKRCMIDVGAYDSMKATAELVPVLLAGELGVAARGSSRSASCLHSFVGGTQVQLADGSTKSIEDVKVGDKVTATDPRTGKTSAHDVLRTIVTKYDKRFVTVTVAGRGKYGSKGNLTATTTHPFWSPSAGGWVNGGDLHAGMSLRTPDGQTVDILSVRHFTKQQVTYDLTIGGVHTYYVLAGETPVLVHNSNCSIDVDFASQSGAKIDPSDKRGEYSMAGRALQKHAGRNGNPNGWPTPSGRQNPGAWNATGQDMLDEILTHPGAVETRGRGRIGGQWQDVVDIRLPNGLGARFTPGGSFSGFLD